MAAQCNPREVEEICNRFNITNLRQNQIDGINAIREKSDLFMGTKTGSGKSLVYESIPVLIPGGCVLVIAPLISIMSEQCTKLAKLGFKATYIGKEPSENDALENGLYDFVYGSPELVVGEKKWRDVLMSTIYQQRLQLIVVDEAHTVIHWGEGSKDEVPFWEWFSKIGELRSLCPKIPIAALTATSSPSQRRKIMESLCFDGNAKVITETPDRSNIKISSICISNNDDLHENFKWLIKNLEEMKEKLPRHIIFCETISGVSKIYCAFRKHLGKNHELVNIYHSKTNEKTKEKIRQDMSVDGKIRVLICTNSAGMGVNYHNLNNIIHYGLPRDMDTFVQQMRRSGRNGEFANELILYKPHKGHLKKVESDLVKLAKDQSECVNIKCYVHAISQIFKLFHPSIDAVMFVKCSACVVNMNVL